MNGIIKIIIVLIALGVGNVVYKINQKPDIVIPPDTWWGSDEPQKKDAGIVPFKINVPKQVLDDLQFRLEHARNFVSPLLNVEQQYGINTNLLKEIVAFWRTKYDWKAQEKFLNQFSQFKTNIQGLDIHYIHVKPEKVPADVKVLPLLLLHGWPGSIREFYEIIPLLTTVQKDQKFVFEVIAPSLPGYGFSQAASKPGLGVNEAAVIFKNLMKKIGFEKYYVQGGDWGSAIGYAISLFYPEHVQGVHLNMCMSNTLLSKLKLFVGMFWPRLVVEEKYEHKLYPLSNHFSNVLLESGYMHLQATKPDTVGVALNDSPVGLAAYIIEKFTTWTNPEWKNRADGGLLEKYTYTKILDNVMIYWVTNSITTSMRFYAESINKNENAFDALPPLKIPSACAIFKNEIVHQSKFLFEDLHPNLLQCNELEGGHFAAFETPNVLAQDIWSAVTKFENVTRKN